MKSTFISDTDEKAVAAPDNQWGGGIEGEITNDDISIPSLNLVQGVGALSEHFKPGQFVLAKELVLSDGTTPLSITVLHVKLSYVEDLEYGVEERRRIFSTAEEVREAGGTLEYIGGEKPSFVRSSKNLIAIESEDDSGLFPHEINGRQFALAEWTLAKTGYNSAGKTIVTSIQNEFAATGPATGSWALTSLRKKFKSNFSYVPVLRHEKRHDADVKAFLEGLAA